MTTTLQQQKPAIVLPSDHTSFTYSINGRNGYKHNDIYQYTTGISNEDFLRDDSFGIVYRAKHKFVQHQFPNELKEHSDDEKDDDNEAKIDIVAKKNVLFDTDSVISGVDADYNDLLKRRSKNKRRNQLGEWNC